MTQTAPNLIYLASASPRRREILENLGYTVRLCSAPIDETPYPHETPHDYVLRMALEKNRAAKQPENANAPLLSADTTVVLNGRILGKPESPQHAAQMLAELSGSTHQVLTAVCVSSGSSEYTALQQSDVRFCRLSETQIAAYIASGEPMDKAGAYGIQGQGGLFVEHLSGSFSGVMGLPVYETAQLLQQCGCPVPPFAFQAA